MKPPPATGHGERDATAPGARPVALLGAGGLVLRGTAQGEPTGPAAILLHGGGQTHRAWNRLALELGRRGWHAIALDLRGHGDSDRAPDGDYRLEVLVADVVQLARQMPAPPVLVGASVSGIASLVAAGTDAREALAGLVLVDVAPTLDTRGIARILGFMRAHLENGFASVEEAAAAIRAFMPERRTDPGGRGLRRYLRLGADGRYRWHWDPAFISGEKWAAVHPHRDAIVAAARRVRVPTLLVRGSESDLVSESAAREFLEIVPHAEFFDVHGAGHMIVGDGNDVFVDRVLSFLEPLRPRAAPHSACGRSPLCDRRSSHTTGSSSSAAVTKGADGPAPE